MEEVSIKPRKCGSMRVEGEGVDRISELPDEVIGSILCSLPLKEAAATSALSSRWLDLWKQLTNLNFDAVNLNIDRRIDGYYCMGNHMVRGLRDAVLRKHIELVSSVLESHKSLSLKTLRIALHLHDSDQDAVVKWLEYADSRKVESLVLDFLCRTPSNLVLEKSLEQSRLFQPQADSFQSLKRLRLKDLKVSGVAIELLLRNCRFLECLSIHRAEFTTDVEICGSTDLRLKHLDVSNCQSWKSIKVSAPNLAGLRITTPLEYLLLDNFPKLIEGDFTSMYYIQKFSHVLSFSQLQSLSLALHFPPSLFCSNGLPQMPNLKKLAIIWCGMYGSSLLPYTAFLTASPLLQEFKLTDTFYCIFPPCLVFYDTKILRSGDETEWPDVGSPHHQHLKLLDFRGFDVHAGTHMELVKYVLDECVGLEKIIIGGPPPPITETARDDEFEKRVAQSGYAITRVGERPWDQGIELRTTCCDMLLSHNRNVEFY